MQKAACWPVASIPPDCLRGFNSLGLEGGNYLRFPRMDVLSNGIFILLKIFGFLLPPPYKSYAACCVNECPPHYVFHQPCTFLHKF